MKSENVIAINYADNNFTDAQKLNSWTAKYIGKANKVVSYGPDDIDKDFRDVHDDILSRSKGGGYWLWKPYIIYKTLMNIKEGSYLFYLDSGCIFLKPIHLFIDFMKSRKIDFLCFYTPFPEKEWDKEILFEKYLSDFNLEEDILQIEGEYVCLRKCNETLNIIKEWLDSCCIAENLLDDDLKPNENHRHDQSNFSLVCKKHGIKAYRNPSNRYLYDLFDEVLINFYRSKSDMEKYKNLYFTLEEVPGTTCSIFSHSRKNANFYLLRVLKSMYLFKRQYHGNEMCLKL